MSRNYAEYEVIKAGPVDPPAPKDDFEAMIEENAILAELNGLLPVVKTA